MKQRIDKSQEDMKKAHIDLKHHMDQRREDLKQEFKNAKEELQQDMGMLVTKFDDDDQRNAAMKQLLVGHHG